MALQREGVGIKMDSGLPHLVLVDDDLFSTGIVVYHLTVSSSPFSSKKRKHTGLSVRKMTVSCLIVF